MDHPSAKLATLSDCAAGCGISPTNESKDRALSRLRILPYVHKLKYSDYRSVESVLSEGLICAPMRGDRGRKWRIGAGTAEDVFLALGALTYPPREGVILVLTLGPSDLSDARQTPWDSGAPNSRYRANPEQAVRVFRDTDLPRPEGMQYGAMLAAGCYSDIDRFPWEKPHRTDPPEVLGHTEEPSWVPEVRIPKRLHVRGRIAAVVSAPTVWADVRARTLLQRATEESRGIWVEAEAEPFELVRQTVEAMLEEEDAGD